MSRAAGCAVHAPPTLNLCFGGYYHTINTLLVMQSTVRSTTCLIIYGGDLHSAQDKSAEGAVPVPSTYIYVVCSIPVGHRPSSKATVELENKMEVIIPGVLEVQLKPKAAPVPVAALAANVAIPFVPENAMPDSEATAQIQTAILASS
ncbi:hypothetical protein SEMRO_470_G028031.1 [Seminavis robusta]|uniref:Uncharacterized protein n=1 Tax=Seminavis robusta TaxID=568900 RepID=A0A9N8DYI1_9STRA|nr:hypothetical protein SEMRO_470_G028031.1 [Seminavis robusta]|eukprot:Sro470_g028031.1  (148) ;mRNA; r:1810-2253